MSSNLQKWIPPRWRRKDAAPACVMSISDPNHVHTDACFIGLEPLGIVELFQSQGCKSCPPALPTIHGAVNNPNLLLLTYDVTYWDNSAGWRDTFGSSQWDARQKQYIMRWGRDGIFTPQVVVDGVADGIGRAPGQVGELIGKARDARKQLPWTLNIDHVGGGVKITSDRAEAELHDVFLVRYHPGSQDVKVGKGPNKGKKVPHRNVVRELTKVGEWRGGEVDVPLPEPGAGAGERAVFVQGEENGQIVGAFKL